VRLAVGRNFSDCSPVKGVYKGSAHHKLEVAVTVDEEDTYYSNEKQIIEVPTASHVTEVSKNSYQRYMEMIQQQQQQQ
jgi:hypothetical protein